MSVYGDLFMQEYSHIYNLSDNMIMEGGQNVVWERELGKTDVNRNAFKNYKDAIDFVTAGDFKKAIRKYRDAKKGFSESIRWINKNVPDDTTGKLLKDPMAQYNALMHSNKNVHAATRNAMIHKQEKLINNCDKQIAYCEKRMRG